MPAATSCVDVQVLKEFLAGRSSADEVMLLEKHLLACDRCAERLNSLVSQDTLIEAMKAQKTDPEQPDSALLREVMQKLRQLRLNGQGAQAEASALEPTQAPAARSANADEGLCEVLAPAQAPDELGRLGSYRVLKVLGAGGMGVVFLAEDPHLKRRIALKAMRPGVATTEAARKRFLREAQATAAIENDHIIPIYQVGEDRGVPFLAMPLLKGEPLDRWLARGGKATPGQILRVGKEIARGLAAAHERNLIHRDIKPANIWLEAPGGRVKILDFGLARAVDDETHLTQTGAIAGTPAYMAPEQARAEKVDGRCDLFSLGCVLYRLCTGALPFQGATTMAVLSSLALDTPRPVAELNPELPPALAELVTQLLAKDPSHRPASAKHVVAALQDMERSLASGGRQPPVEVSQQGADAPRSPERAAGPRPESTQVSPRVIMVPGKPDPGQPAQRPAAAGRRVLASRRLQVAVLAAVLLAGGGLLAQVIIRIKHKDGKVTEIPVPPGAEVEIVRPLPEPLGSGTWKLGPADKVLPGFIPRPAQLPRIQRWQLATAGPRSEVGAVAWSPDGKFLAVGEITGEVWLHDARTPQLPRLLLRHGNSVRSVAWSPDSQRLASAGHDYTVRVWSVDGTPGPILRGAQNVYVNSVAWSPDGKRLASAHADSTVRLWGADGTPGPVLNGGPGNVSAVAWSPDSKRLASCGSNDKTVRLWEADGTPGPVLKGHTASVVSLAWSPDGKRLASGSYDKTVRLWEADGKEVAILKGHTGPVGSVAWSRDGQHLASASQDGAVRLWGADGTQGPVLKGHAPGLTFVDWSPDSKSVVSGGVDKSIRLWSADGTPGPVVAGGLTNGLWSVAWSPDGKRLASAGRDSTVRLWGIDGAPIAVLPGHTKEALCVAWSPDGKRLASGGMDSTVRLWSADGTPRSVLKGHRLSVNSVAWSPDSKRLASGSSDGMLRLWDADGTAGPVLLKADSFVYSVAWSADGQRLASGHGDKTVRLWTADGKRGPVLQGHTAAVISMAWSPDGKRLASVSVDTTIRLWESDGKPGPVIKGPGGTIHSVVWSPDGRSLATAHLRGVQLWSADGKAGPFLRGYRGAVRSVAWNADGRRIATASDDGMILQWDATRAEPTTVIVPLLDKQSVTFSAAGQLLHGDPGTIEKGFVYLLEQGDARVEVLKPSEFRKRAGLPEAPADRPAPRPEPHGRVGP